MCIRNSNYAWFLIRTNASESTFVLSQSYCGTDWVKQITTPFNALASAVTSYEYDKNGNVTKESVINSAPKDSKTTRETNYEYDYLGRLTKSTLGDDYTTYEYDNVGNITKTIMANGAQTVSYNMTSLTDLSNIQMPWVSPRPILTTTMVI